ncbi:MAG: molybdopterin-binding protein [Chromatiales bacterium]|nr:molybdopterin-binding protein [Chromatiales bacterium]
MKPTDSVSSQVEAHNRPLLPVAEALQQIREAIDPIKGNILCHLKEAYGHIVANDILSPIAVPGYDNSAMDGYAFHAEDLSDSEAKTLKLIGKSLAGDPFDGALHPGECVRITTGAMIPEGTGFVVMQEQTTIDGEQITIQPEHKIDAHIRRAGEDIARGGVVFEPGQKIGAAELGLLASLGVSEIEVIRPLRIATFSTGDELASLGQPLGEGQIYDSNRYALYGLIKELGATHIDMGIIRDTREAVASAFEEAANIADVVITSGGVSVGDADYVKETLERMGAVNFWKIAMKPGKPLAYGKIGNAWFFGLPGNPVSSMATYIKIVRPNLEYLAGQSATVPLRLTVKTIDPLKKRPGRADFQRGILSYEGDELVVRTTGHQGSHVLSSMSRANCFIALSAESGSVAAGEMVEVEPFGTTL